ncbi:MAG: dephospho-CoA kinase [Planctomycetota bacterium]
MAETQDITTKPIIGLMGGPGSGKSTVAQLFAELGCAIIDADRLGHAALSEPGVVEQVRTIWGEAPFGSNGQISRSALGRIVFADPAALRQLEGLIHPVVHAGRERQRNQNQADPSVVAIVEDCPLLLESKLDKQCDTLVFVDAPDELRLERVAATRGWDMQELKKREQQQAPLDTKRRSADYVISNDQDLAHVREQVRHVLQSITHTKPS